MIEVKDISKRFGKKDAVVSVSFSVNKEECVGLVGVNGAGKTTLISMIIGLLSPCAGSIRVFGRAPYSSAVRMKVGYMPEIFVPPSNLSVREFLKLICVMKKGEKQSVEDYLKVAGLEDESSTLIGKLSKGMKQRLGIAMAMTGNPELIILDEPFSGLDPIGRSRMKELILRMHSSGKTILFSSHILQDVEDIVRRVLVMHRGRFIYDGSVSAFIERYSAENFEDAFIRAVEEKAP